MVQEAKRLPFCFLLMWKSLHGWVFLFPGYLLRLKAIRTLSSGLRCLLSGDDGGGAGAAGCCCC